MLLLEVEPDGAAFWFLQNTDFGPIQSIAWTAGAPLPEPVVLLAQTFRA
jgi:hypothetical protein